MNTNDIARVIANDAFDKIIFDSRDNHVTIEHCIAYIRDVVRYAFIDDDNVNNMSHEMIDDVAIEMMHIMNECIDDSIELIIKN